MNIRRATESDAARLAQLSGVLGYPVSPNAMAHRLARILSRPEDVIFVAEEPTAGIIGWIHGAERDTLESDLRCEILGLVVDATHRGRGVVRIESHPFYERLGYVRVKTSHIYRKALSKQGA
jgi:ribosomal protein S18 acetylase RimI-like enzyme